MGYLEDVIHEAIEDGTEDAMRAEAKGTKSGRGGARAGAGRPPVAGQPQDEHINLTLTEAERAEIEAAVPAGKPVGRWIVKAALAAARRG